LFSNRARLRFANQVQYVYKNGVASRLIFIELMNPESDKKRVRFFGNISK